MRPISALATLILLLAAAIGGYALHRGDPPLAPSVQTGAMDAALPPAQAAALPAEAGTDALPSLAPMLQNVTPAVVNIQSKQIVRVRNPLAEDPLFRQLFGMPDVPQERIRQSLGSGVVVDAQRGLVLTNNHVIEAADGITVTLADGRTLEGKTVGADPDSDVALVKIPAQNLTALKLADSSKLRVGDFVVAVGNPFGLGQTVTSGIVSALGRSGLQGLGYQNFIQTDASINPGNSGGALVNLRGELVGINTAIFNPSGSSSGNIGIGFAIPSSMAGDVMRQLLATGKVARGSLGAETQDISDAIARAMKLPSRRGALVARVYPGSSAAAAGLQTGDVIQSINGQNVVDRDSLRNQEGLLPVGRPVSLQVWRHGKSLALSAALKVQADKLSGGQLDPRLAGATFGELPEGLRQRGASGVVIAQVAAGSRAAANNLQPGDLVAQINHRDIDDLPAFQAALTTHPAELQFTLVRGQLVGTLSMQ
jgi:Do/DeqQ family serine protease